MSQTNRNKIAEAEARRFLAEQANEKFAPLDLSGYPHLTPKLTAEQSSFIDSRFAPLDERAKVNGVSLKAFINKPDDETLNTLAKTDPQLKHELLEIHAEQIAEEFMARTPEYYCSAANYETIVWQLAKSKLGNHRFPDVASAEHELAARGLWTVSNLSTAFSTLWSQGQMETAPGSARPLSESELQEIAAQAATWGAEDAVKTYIYYALGDAINDYQEPADFLAKNTELASEAARFVFFSLEPAVDSEDFRQFEDQFFTGKYLRTYSLYKQAWIEFQKFHERQKRLRLFEGSSSSDHEAETPEPDLNDLDDESISRLLRQTVRIQLRSSR